MKYFICVLLLAGCDLARWELNSVESEIHSCRRFKTDFEKVGVKDPQGQIKAKIEKCKVLGAWDPQS